MQLNDRDKAYLWDISEACKDIMQFIQNTSYHEYAENKLIRFAVERQVLVIGEAANHLSKDFVDNAPEIPWKRIVGLRNIIAHDYGSLLSERIWLIAKNHIPELLDFVDKILP